MEGGSGGEWEYQGGATGTEEGGSGWWRPAREAATVDSEGGEEEDCSEAGGTWVPNLRGGFLLDFALGDGGGSEQRVGARFVLPVQ